MNSCCNASGNLAGRSMRASCQLVGARAYLRRLALLALMLPLLAEPAAGLHAQGDVLVKAPHAILIDADTGATLSQRGADELVYPASMSKLMVLAMAFKALKAGEIKLDDEWLMTEYAWRKGGAPSGTSAMMVPVGTKATVEDLLKGIVVQSGNDAAIAVAEALGGNEPRFAEMMTQEARRLGLKKSVFKNATGLFHPEHQMTARELAMLAAHLIREYPEQYKMFAMREFPYRKHKFINRNPLLNLVAGVDGLKTGFIKEAGYGMVASAKQDNRRLIAVVLGLATADERREDARRLLEWGFKGFAEAKIFDAGEVVGHARVWGGRRMFVPLTGKGDVTIWLPRLPANPRLRANIIYKWPLKGPLAKGDQVAMLRVTSASDAMSEVPLYAAEDVAAAGTLRRGLDSLICLATRWLP
jgi:serine-type D-Ala-D-Ala carboxypeptidase (penicillin-binding protein 5/6)